MSQRPPIDSGKRLLMYVVGCGVAVFSFAGLWKLADLLRRAAGEGLSELFVLGGIFFLVFSWAFVVTWLDEARAEGKEEGGEQKRLELTALMQHVERENDALRRELGRQELSSPRGSGPLAD